MKILQKITYSVAAIFVVVFFIFSCLVGGVGVTYAANLKDPVTVYEQQNVLDDLKGSTVNGKVFDLSEWNFDESGKTKLVSFVEYGYSFKSEKANDYGLYVYLYNPQGLKIDTNTERNKIQFAYAEKDNWDKYVLELLNYSVAAGYEGLFYKFKVALSDSRRVEILNSQPQQLRIYKISGIELSVGGNVVDYANADNKVLTYKYSGFAKGYGSDLSTDDTLSCTVDGLEMTRSLDVHSTYYRPKGTNGDAYARDTLHSVYFSVPNEIIAEYGEMTAVHAKWLNAYTAPILVTGNKMIYDAILPFVGEEIDGGKFHYVNDDTSPLRYSLLAGDYNESASWNHASHGAAHISYNANSYFTNSKKTITNLQYLFLAANGDADNFTLPAEALIGNKAQGIKGWFETFTQIHGGELVNNSFSTTLFESVADKFTDITITVDDNFTLTDEVVSQSLWQKFVGGGYNVTGSNTYTISAIKKVEKSDFKSDKAETCNGLYIDQSDYEKFKAYYDDAIETQKTVYLFRYFQSDYVSYEAIEYGRGKGDWTLLGTEFDYEYIDTNAYFAQTWVQLDFDIIDLTFTKNNVKTVIPVVMSPMDIVPDVDPPVITTPDKDNKFNWKLVLALLAGIVLLIVFAPILQYVIAFVLGVIALPFKLFGVLFKRKKE